jgi:hypothetical protein
VSLAVLYVLATLDGMMCGYRAAAGRSALIDKRAYYRKAMQRGVLWAQVASLVAAAALAVIWKVSPDRSGLLTDLQHAAHRMLWVFVPYAAIVVGALLVRLVPSTDIRSATSVMIFGPMTGLRPFVTVAGVLYGILPAKHWETIALGALVLALMMSVEPLLNRIVELQRVETIQPAVPTSPN